MSPFASTTAHRPHAARPRRARHFGLEALECRSMMAADLIAAPCVEPSATDVPPCQTADFRIAAEPQSEYSAPAFVGGWGSSMYQYATVDPNLVRDVASALVALDPRDVDAAVVDLTAIVYGNRGGTTVQDDVIVDGRIITAENYDSASLLPRLAAAQAPFLNDQAAMMDLAECDSSVAENIATHGYIRVKKLNSGG